MAREYKTLKFPVTAELTEKRSRFVANLFPSPDLSVAVEHLSLVKRKYHDAKHNAYACVLISGKKKFSDDGEPGGTAGRPILDILEKNGIFNVIAIVSRYFGGVLLGTGGLVRAYSGAVLKAFEVAEFDLMMPCDYC